jgi:hypothetical protein
MSRQPGDNWSQEKVEILSILCAAGFTGQEIADKMGFSRSKVIGKLWRMGMKLTSLAGTRGFHKNHTHETKLKISAGMKALWRRRNIAMDRAEGLCK